MAPYQILFRPFSTPIKNVTNPQRDFVRRGLPTLSKSSQGTYSIRVLRAPGTVPPASMGSNENHRDGSTSSVRNPDGRPAAVAPDTQATPTEDPERDAKQEKEKPDDDTAATPSWSRLLFIGAGLWCAVFLVALVSLCFGDPTARVRGEPTRVNGTPAA